MASLINITTDASKAGFKIPVSVTDTVWNKYIAWTDKDSQQQTVQDKVSPMGCAFYAPLCVGNRAALPQSRPLRTEHESSFRQV